MEMSINVLEYGFTLTPKRVSEEWLMIRTSKGFLPMFTRVTVPDEKVYKIGKYGRMHAKFFKENRPCFYTARMIDGTWLDYLKEIGITAKEMVDRLIKDMATKQRITETLKATDQFAWVSAMEQIKHTAEE